MLRNHLFQLAALCIAIYGVVPLVQAEITKATGIEWQTDLAQGIQLAKAKSLPLVVYIFSENEDGPLAVCREFEAGPLASRELRTYKDDAIFVKVNAARDDDNGYVRRLFMDLHITEVPTVSVLECRQEGNLATTPVVGNILTSDFVTLIRRGLIETQVSIRTRDRAPSTDDEFIRGVEGFRAEFSPMVDEFWKAYDRRRQVLSKLSSQDEFQLKELEEADRSVALVQNKMIARLDKFLELNRPEIRALCIAEFELHGTISENMAFLRADLDLFTINGQVAGTFPTTMARVTVSKSQRRFDDDFQQRRKSFDDFKSKLNQQYEEVVKRKPAGSNR